MFKTNKNDFQVLNLLNIKIAINFLRTGLPVRILDENGEGGFFYSGEILELNNALNADFEMCFTAQKASFIKDLSADNGVKVSLKNGQSVPNSSLENIANRLCFYAHLMPVCAVYKGGAVLDIHANLQFIPQVSVQDIQDFDYGRYFELNHVANSDVALKNANLARFYTFRSPFSGEEHYAIVVKNALHSPAPLVRLHSSCYTGDLLASLRCDCRDQLQDAIEVASTHPDFDGGIVLYLMQEGRGINLINKIRAYNVQNILELDTVDSNRYLGFGDDERNFLVAAKILEFFNINTIHLLSNNPKKQSDLENFGIKVAGLVSTVFSPNEHNKSYLDVKAKRMNHNFDKRSS
jgi:GTP cyclohydrolase II